MDEKDQADTNYEVDFRDRASEVIGENGEPEEILYRTIIFQQPNEGQIAVIARAVRKAMRGGPGAVEAVALVLDVIDALVVERDDANWLEDGLISRNVELNDFIGVLDGMNKTDEQATKKPVPAVRRGRR